MVMLVLLAGAAHTAYVVRHYQDSSGWRFYAVTAGYVAAMALLILYHGV
jgi:hypothetical protein